MSLINRFFLPPDRSFFLFGPRGTGKSTWVKNHYPHGLYIDLLKPATLQSYLAQPDRLVDMIEDNLEKKNHYT